ncbi:unnamed protein product, partial [Ixodes hexagonus]
RSERRRRRRQAPHFERSLYIASVPEGRDRGYVVETVTATSAVSSDLSYSLHAVLDARSQAMFSIDPLSGVVTTTTILDREFIDVHYLRVVAVDGSTQPATTATSTLQVNVLDENDHAPSFEQATYEASIRESVPTGYTVLTVRATDQDAGSNANVDYSILNPDGTNSAFGIDSKSGIITTRSSLDRELTSFYALVVQATDSGPVTDRKSASTTVEITVLDENDNYPQFSERSYSVKVSEDVNWLNHPEVARVRAVDADQGANAALRYSLIGGNTQGHFAMDSLTGSVTILSPLDYETARSYRLVVRVQDGGTPSRSNTTQLLVNVLDINDNDPKFYTSLFHETVPENVPVGHSIVRVQAYDADDGANAEISYTLSSSERPDLPLSVDDVTGWVSTTRQLDREESASFNFQVVARDHGTPSRSATASILLRVQDVNDNDPVFEPRVYEATVSEADPPGTPVVSVTASDRDEHSRLVYQITSGNTRERFGIVSHNRQAVVSIAQPLDYKLEKRFVLVVTATDSGGRSDSATVYLNVSDANTHRPTFERTPYTASVPEDVPVGTTVLVVEAHDGDVGRNALVTYTLEEDVPEFRMDSATGALLTARPLDRERTSGYTLVVMAQDGGNPPLSDTTNIELEVADVNDNAPVFPTAGYTSTVSEDALVGTSVAHVSATDADLGLNGQIRYTFLGGNDGGGAFGIDPTSGIIRTSRALDRETLAIYNLVAFAVDRGSPSLSASVALVVYVEDVNDSPPRFSADRIRLFVPENSPVGSVAGEVRAHDPDEGPNAVVQYAIVGGPDADAFSLVARPGEAAEIVTLTELDYESRRKKYVIVVRASSPPLRNDVEVEIWVTDVNDNAPMLKRFIFTFSWFTHIEPINRIKSSPLGSGTIISKLTFFLSRPMTGHSCDRLRVKIEHDNDKQNLSDPSDNTELFQYSEDGMCWLLGVEAVCSSHPRPVRGQGLLGWNRGRRLQLQRLHPGTIAVSTVTACKAPLVRQNIAMVGFTLRSIVGEATVVSAGDVAGQRRRGNWPAQLVPLLPQPRDSPEGRAVAFVALSASQYSLQFFGTLNIGKLLFLALCFGCGSRNICRATCFPSIQLFSCHTPWLCKKHSIQFTNISQFYPCLSSPCPENSVCLDAWEQHQCKCNPGEGARRTFPLGHTSGTQSNNFRCLASSQTLRERTVAMAIASPLTHIVILFCFFLLQHMFCFKTQCPPPKKKEPLFYLYFYPSLDLFHQSSNLLFVTAIFSLSIRPSMSANPSAPSKSLHMLHRVSISWNFALYVLVLSTPVLASNSNELPNELSYNCSLFISCFCARYIASSSAFRFSLSSPSFLSSASSLASHFVASASTLFLGWDTWPSPSWLEWSELLPCSISATACRSVSHSFLSLSALSDGNCASGSKSGRSSRSAADFSLCRFRCSDACFTRDGYYTASNAAQSILTLEKCGSSIHCRRNSAKSTAPFAVLCCGEAVQSSAISNGQVVTRRLKLGAITHNSLNPHHGPVVSCLACLPCAHACPVGLQDANSANSRNGLYEASNTSSLRHMFSRRPPTACSLGLARALHCTRASRCSPVPEGSWTERRFLSAGHVGSECVPACSLSPCESHGKCLASPDGAPGGFVCECESSRWGRYCGEASSQPCPFNWWGSPVCGPCHCPVHRGYHADCNKTTGECFCQENHYQPEGSDVCYPCDCYANGSYSNRCHPVTGQCRCRPGVIGRQCDACSNRFAEVTLRGCEVIYDGCPRSMSERVWWERALFNQQVSRSCPKGAQGKATRLCDQEGGWLEPDTFGCVSDAFAPLSEQLRVLERDKLPLNTFSAVRVARQLRAATNASGAPLYGTDVLLASRLLHHLLSHENHLSGLNLTHRQDRDFVRHLVWAASAILDERYAALWERVAALTGQGPPHLLKMFEKYAHTLASSQRDTFTDPFELTAPNMVLGMDTVSTSDLAGPFVEQLTDGSWLRLPKYNNYPLRKAGPELPSVFLPLSALSLASKPEPLPRGAGSKAVVVYAFYPHLHGLFPTTYDPNVRQRFGVELSLGGPVSTLVVQPAGASGPVGTSRVRLRFPRDRGDQPQCVFWMFSASGRGKWSTRGCKLEAVDVSHINCTCDHLSSFAVLTDIVSREHLAEVSPLEGGLAWSGLLGALSMLLLTWLVLSLLRGGQGTNSLAIHRNLVACLWMSLLLFLVALKLRRTLLHHEFPCKLLAIALHYGFLCIFSWLWLDAVHLYRMLTEMKDVNHGHMRFYYALGYGAPAVIVGLAVGVRADHYATHNFCWLSMYESIVWSMVGPVCVMVLATLVMFSLSIRASVQIKDTVMDFGNLRVLLWVSVLLLPLVGGCWTLALLSVGDEPPVLRLALPPLCFLTGLYVFLGYCILNRRVRQHLCYLWARLRGRKLPYDESLTGTRASMISRSALAYHNSSFDVLHRNVGISTSSTTSRSTAKTSSSPWNSNGRVPRRRPHVRDDPDTGEATRKRRTTSDSDSEMSLDHASLDLASSHSSDEEEAKPPWRGDVSALAPVREEDVQQAPPSSVPRVGHQAPPSLWDCGLPPQLGSLPCALPPVSPSRAWPHEGELRNNLDQATPGKEGVCHKPNMLAASDSE